MSVPTKRAREALDARLERFARTPISQGGACESLRLALHEGQQVGARHTEPVGERYPSMVPACEAGNQLSDLIATVRTIESMYVEWRRTLRTGMKHCQKKEISLYERTKLFRAYEPGLIPGLFQTAEYASAIIAHLIAFNQTPDDLEGAVSARMERRRVLRTGDRRFLFVLEEQEVSGVISFTPSNAS